jgi:hypothetical protein
MLKSEWSTGLDVRMRHSRHQCTPGPAGIAQKGSGLSRFIGSFETFDLATILFLAALVVIALCTFGNYAISNDEGVQIHYGKLIVDYYASGFRDQDVFSFQNLYLYGGLFDVIAIALSHLLPVDPYDLRHILSALTGIGGVAAAAAAARLVAGPRAGLLAAISLSLCGVWYGSMFNHTKDIPFAAAMMGATFFLLRIARRLPSPRGGDIVAFGLLAGAALGIRILGLLLVVYAGFAILLCLSEPSLRHARLRFVTSSAVKLLPAFAIAYFMMILAWPWAALSPLNPIRGLLAFSEFHYGIRTAFAGTIYEMGDVPRLYVPTYVLIRLPLLTLLAAGFAMTIAFLRVHATDTQRLEQRDIALLSLTVIFPVACHVISHGPAFTGLRHFLFVIPPIAALAGVGLDGLIRVLGNRSRALASTGFAVLTACFLWDAVTLVRLHPYEYLYYNSLVGGLEGASRRYDLDYWFDAMPEAIGQLEAYVRSTAPADANWPERVYSVAVCGERLEFEKVVTLPQLHWDFKPEWRQSEFFIAPTQMNCDEDLDGKIVGTVERLGVPIAYVKDRRALMSPTMAAAPR